MTQHISSRVRALAPSATLAMSQMSAELKAQGIDVINLSVGEPDFFTPEHIKQAAHRAIDDNFSFYTPVPGYLSLRKAICEKLLRENDLEFTPEQIVVGNGAKHALCNTVMALVNPGDEVIIPTPSWVSYGEMVKLAGGKVISIPTTAANNYCLTVAQLREAITPRTRMLILCSPNNPTGTIYSNSSMDELADVLRAYPDIAVLSDEIYNGLTYGTHARSWAYYADLAERLISVNGISKTYAMTGYRIGWSLCKNKAFNTACSRLQSQQFTCATVIAQKAAEAALTGEQQSVEQLRAEFAQRRDLICRLAKEIKTWSFVEPQGAFYLFPDVRALGTGDAVAEMLLEKAHVAVVSGSAFGDPSCIRLSFAISNEAIVEAIRRIKNALNQ